MSALFASCEGSSDWPVAVIGVATILAMVALVLGGMWINRG